MENILQKINKILSNKAHHNNELYEELTMLYTDIHYHRKELLRKLDALREFDMLAASIFLGSTGATLVHGIYKNVFSLLVDEQEDEKTKIKIIDENGDLEK